MSELEKFKEASMRGPKKGIYEQLLASILAKGVKTNDPLIKVSCICEGAYMSKIRDKLDIDLVDACYAICQSFQNTETSNTKKTKLEYVNVSWSFPKTEENWKLYIDPWQKTRELRFYTLLSNYREVNYPSKDRWVDITPWEEIDHYNKMAEYKENLAKQIASEVRALPPDRGFFEIATALDMHSYRRVKGEFTTWALKQLLQTQTILSDEISPQVWREATSQPSEEEEENLNGD